jgi:hypothetical protein
VTEATARSAGPRRVRDWRLRRRTAADLGRWPFRVGICAALAVWAGLVTLLQRDALAPPRWLVVGLVVLAVLPWLVDLLLAEVPPLLFAPVVLVPVVLLYEPTRGFDAPWLLLAVLALDMGLWLGTARSVPVVLAAVAVVVWPVVRGADVAVVPARPLTAIAGAWVVGLALHSQVRRAERLRGERDEVDARLREVLAGVAAARAALDRGEVTDAGKRLAGLERAHARAARSPDEGVSDATGRGGRARA